MIRADVGRFELDRDEAVRAQVKGALLFRRELVDSEALLAQSNRNDLVRSGIPDSSPGERPFENCGDVIRGDQADEHADAERNEALDENPAEVFEVFEETFYRSTFLILIGAFGVI